MRALEAALNTIWAMEERSLEQLLTIAAREHETTPEAIEAYAAKSLANSERARERGGVAIIDVIGATFKRANLFVAMSGATSYEIIRADLQAAVDNPKVKAILLNIDSPGGEASGVSEVAEAIHSMRGVKPITAYIGGMGASAGYWMASAADRIVIDPTALLGSIGVQWAVRGDPPANDKQAKTYRFVSSQSPLKNASPDTEEGFAHLQSAVDAMAQVFVETVARNRGVDTETVLKDFGKGGIFVGKDAVKAGLADELGSFEGVLAELSGGRKKNQAIRPSHNKGTAMSETAAEPATEPKAEVVDVNAAVASALAAERSRNAGIDRIAAAHGVAASVVASAKEDGSTVEAFALKVADLTAAKAAEAGTAALAALQADETTAGKVENTAPVEDETADAAAARIAAA